MMKKLELDELNEKIEKLEADLALWDGREEILCNLIDEKDAEISKLKADIQCMCDKAARKYLPGYREMGAKLAEKIERLKLEILNGR